jgi:1-aminocyclopropane-1-carboxylate deaminase/D-cysteine desulfhydrase-like pyridoxal-dependent ACC family enzyme
LIAASPKREGRINASAKTVFLHTGGTPALFARSYAEWISSPPCGPAR